MAEYTDLVLSGKGVSQIISNGDSAYNTTVRNGATLRISAGGRVELTTVLNSTTISNAGLAISTFLSGGTMQLLTGGTATTVSVLRNARLTVANGAVATNLYVSSGNVNTIVRGGDNATLISGTNELGEFFLSGGVASNFLMNSLGQLTVSSGGSAAGTVIKGGAAMTISKGGIATDITQSAGGNVTASVWGGDSKTLVTGVNSEGSFYLSNGVASNFMLYDGGAQNISSGGTALHTLVNGQRAFQNIWSGGVASETSVYRNGIVEVYEGGAASNIMVYSGGSMVTRDAARVAGATVSGAFLVESAATGEDESGGCAAISDIFITSGGSMKVVRKADFSGVITIAGNATLGNTMTMADGASLVLDITGRGNDAKAILSDWTMISGAAYSLSVSVGDTPVTGFYKLAGNAATFARTITVNSGATELGTLTGGGEFLNDGLRYSLAVDGANALLLTIADTEPPTLNGLPEAAVSGYSVTITWNPATDKSGIKNYVLRVGDSDYETTGTSCTLTDLALGDYSYQLQAVDIYDNKSVWSAVQEFTVVDITPKNVTLDSHGAKWDASVGVTGYVAELSTNDFTDLLRFAVSQPGIDFYNPANGNYSFRTRADIDTVFSDVAETTVTDAETGAVKFVSDDDGIADVFFAQSDDVWRSGYFACHVGTESWEGGTGESIALNGKNRIANVFRGSDDASILFLSDSDNGDALELDDIFTALPDGESDPVARFSKIGEVRAGAGDDVVDLTSTKFTADGMIIRGGDGDDVLWGADGGDFIFGDSGNDRMAGGADDDVLCGGSGDDRMHGGGGSDIFTFAGNWGNDTVIQTADGDITLWFADLTAEDVSINYSMGNTVIGHGDNSVTVANREIAEIGLRFGAAGYEAQFADLDAMGAFADYSSARIFENKDSISVIASLT